MKSFRLKNFKCFEDTGEIEIKPITLFYGKNNSGKSSALRFLKMLCNTINKNSPLFLFERDYKTTVFNHDVKLNIGFEFSFDPSYAPHSNFPQFGDNGERPLTNLRSELGYREEGTYNRYNQLNYTEISCKEGIFLIVVVDEKGVSINGKLLDLPPLLLYGFIPKYFHKIERRDSQVRGVIYNINSFLTLFANTTTYLTANHPPPQYSYVYNPKGEKEVGEQAQHLPDILGYQKDQKNTVFFDKLNDLLKKHLKVTIEVETFRNNTLIIEIIDENGVKNILPDVGAGIVQVLPVFVQSVLADQQSAFSTIIIEEPESNLNPYAQAELADVFIASAKLHSNNRFLLETHSETLVLRLQRRILEGEISPSDVAIYFVERKKEGIGSEIKRVQWDEDAQTFDFPEEFFDADYIEARAITKLQTPKKITDLAW